MFCMHLYAFICIRMQPGRSGTSTAQLRKLRGVLGRAVPQTGRMHAHFGAVHSCVFLRIIYCGIRMNVHECIDKVECSTFTMQTSRNVLKCVKMHHIKNAACR